MRSLHPLQRDFIGIYSTLLGRKFDKRFKSILDHLKCSYISTVLASQLTKNWHKYIQHRALDFTQLVYLNKGIKRALTMAMRMQNVFSIASTLTFLRKAWRNFKICTVSCWCFICEELWPFNILIFRFTAAVDFCCWLFAGEIN